MGNSTTHRTIMISSALMGAQQVVRLVVGVIQSKIVAVLLGTTGTGTFGIYASLLDMGQSVFGLGLAGSGVQHIAASRKKDANAIPSLDIRIQLWLGVLLGSLAGFMMFTFRHSLSRITFGDVGHADAIGFIAGATAAALMTTGLLTALQGLRRLRDLTFVDIGGSVLSALAAIALIYYEREHGIAPAYLATSGFSWLMAWLFFRRIQRQTVGFSLHDVLHKVANLVRLGSGFMSASLFTALTAYAVRTLLAHYQGIETVGLYQAAWMLSTFYCTMVLRAMGTDFFPRISALSAEPDALNLQVNEQTEVGFILVTPGLLLGMTAAAPVLRILYTDAFTEAVVVARWMLAGMLVRAAGWPLAYVPLALNRPLVTFLTESLFTVVLVGLSSACIPFAGLNGAGVAFFVTSLVYTSVLLIASRRLTGFTWSGTCRKTMLWTYSASVAVFVLLIAGGRWAETTAWLIASITSVFCGILAIRLLKKPT
jgi:PST family polysaccharide transporter